MDLLPDPVCPAAGLEAVLSTAELSQRPSRPADHAAENRALVALARKLTAAPDGVLQELAEIALGLCQAHSAGVSILEEEDGRQVFRWHGVAGQLAPYLRGTLPRQASPCGTVLDRCAAQLMTRPERHYLSLASIMPPVEEVLLVPFFVAGRAIGTVWAVAHGGGRRFDAEDLRVLASLTGFAAAAYQLLQGRDALAAAYREADRRKDEFLATLAHELRNPLAPIRNSLQVLRMTGGAGPAAGRVHDMLERQVGHLVRLVDDLMEVSRISRGKVELRKERVELAAVVRGAVETSRPLVEAAGHRLTVRLPDEPLPLEADPVRLAQVLANLLNNAAKYTDNGGQIWLTARREGGEAVVAVRDTGVGIPADMQPRVFEMFTQVDRTLGRAQGGLGIGLALVKSLVQMHGGRVGVASDGPGKGSEFTVRLPLAGAPGAAAEGRARGDGRQAAGVPPRRILVVDDNRDAADSLGMLLKFLGADARVVYDGPSALEAVRAYRPAVMLLDVGMPGMDGFEVARRVRQDPASRDVVLIALTGWGQAEDRRRTQEAGFGHHLVKPVDSGALQALLASLEDGAPGGPSTEPARP